MKEAPKVSVILPVYNVEAYIGHCIESLQNQTLHELEFIFVDDCSTDSSMAAVETWANQDNRVRIFYNDQNLGQGPTRNRGIEAARGAYLAFMDPDDYVAPNFYQLLYTAATTEGVHDIAKGLRCLVEATTGEVAPPNKTLNNRIRTDLADSKPLYTAFTYEHLTAIYRRELFSDSSVRYGTSRNSEDITFLLRCCYQTNDLVFEESAIYFYVQREGSIVHGDSMKIAHGQINALTERFAFLSNKGMDDTALQYLLARANDCLVRLHGALKNNRVCPEDYDYIAARITDTIKPIPGAFEAINEWPRLQAALKVSYPELAQEYCKEAAAVGQPQQAKASTVKEPSSLINRGIRMLKKILKR